jgi:hypothetical protein
MGIMMCVYRSARSLAHALLINQQPNITSRNSTKTSLLDFHYPNPITIVHIPKAIPNISKT